MQGRTDSRAAPNTISQYLKFRIYTELCSYCLQQAGRDNGATKLERQTGRKQHRIILQEEKHIKLVFVFN